MPHTLYWNRSELQPELVAALEALGQEYPLVEGAGAPQLQFAQDAPPGSVTVSRHQGAIGISYGAPSDALRGLGAALAGLPAEGELRERRGFDTFGIMLDCSRNAVMKVEHLKRWLRRLSLLGYNMVMLYTEDTYRLSGEHFFGFLRGAYTHEELKEIDDYAAALGIEMIGCIQTLGHLEQILKWGAYRAVKDTDRELLVGEDATYALIEKMIANFAQCFRSRRIHVGMDETWTLGRGRFLDRNGQKPGFEILTQHLQQVSRICEQRGLRPMIWSDMYFKFGERAHMDYDPSSSMPDEVKAAIPEQLDLVYWDYYHDDQQFYADMIQRHRDLGREPIMGSGVWTWMRLWHGRLDTERNAGACIRACRETGLKEIFFTMWADDGGYCEFDSALAGLAFTAALAYQEQEASLQARFQAVCGMDYDLAQLPAALEDWSFDGALSDPDPHRPACMILWDDPLLGIHWLSVKARRPDYWKKALTHYRRVARKVKPHREITEPVDLGHGFALAQFLAAKIAFRQRLEEAYQSRDAAALKGAARSARSLARLANQLEATFRRQWLRRNKPFGLEVMQIRFAGLRQRFLEAAQRIEGLAAGEIESIPELEEGLAFSGEELQRLWVWGRYRNLATSSSIL
jgi:hypothetical protein